VLYFLVVVVVLSISKYDQLHPYMVFCEKNILKVSIDCIYHLRHFFSSSLRQGGQVAASASPKSKRVLSTLQHRQPIRFFLVLPVVKKLHMTVAFH
jgi:hypothetical protein